jgi:hypothetical protein
MDFIPQDQAYHQFADTRRLLEIPNFWNVASNLLFTIFGLMGVRLYLWSSMKLSWLVFFSGAALVGPGSAFYHYNPHDLSLVFDRIPMTIAFAGIFSAVVTDVFDLKGEKLLLTMTLGLPPRGGLIPLCRREYWWRRQESKPSAVI